MTRDDGERRGRSEKRCAILAGALTIFARDGYTRAGIDAIAAEAGVSTRTIYNHFQDKAGLFQAVIQDSATRVADAQIAIVDRHLRKVTDLEADLVAFGRDWVTAGQTEHAAHSALVRQVNAESGHVPQAAIEAWQEAGPLRVRGALAARLEELARQGLLKAGDPRRAALHLMILTATSNPSYRGARLSEAEAEEMVTAGVRAFLYGYGG
ncbi:TetR/AcrR family transcriptional regulator [Actinomadura macrotermitis]|uniref:HTH tetR-type domain-containing protein n=1 Tax=Actinomadura macrotermitis TaxID=2585200 RepID=A0A7K0BYZ6_9ACTN|nr:TetR/AcrR family transcriptional regulator [Actinomadura macrotermitis]MQY06393.1 hypothetical protein [Actinomadura macrotermitis]